MADFFIERMDGALLKGKRKSDFTQALERLLKKYCGSAWEYNVPDDGMWGD